MMKPLAPHACASCRSRKRACDKKLPSCGYCTRQAFVCTYNSGLSTPVPGAKRHQSGSVPSPSALHALDAVCTQGPLRMAELDMVHTKLAQEVSELLQSLNLDVADVTARYFRVFHPWLPIVSPLLADEHDVPHTADTSVLFLAMCTITQHPVSDDTYLATRMLFAQGQLAVCASLRLVQALLLITVYEYARGWSRAARLTIAYCASMACELGLDHCRVRDAATQDSWWRAEAVESWNTWWGIVIVERLAHQDLNDHHDGY